MADNYEYVTESGIIVPDVSSIQEDVEAEYKETFGADLNTTTTSIAGRLIERDVSVRKMVLGICALVANQINIDYATGDYLDAIGAFFGVERKSAIRTRVLATVTGVNGTVVPSGSQVKSTQGYVFYAENDITIGNAGTATGYFLSIEAGEIPLAVNTLTEIVSQTVGWETINNPAAAVIGSDKESDFYYRKRIKNSRYVGRSLIESIGSRLQLVDGVRSSFIKNNGTNEAETYDSIDIPPHSVLIVVDGGEDEDVATAIFEKISGGCGYTEIENQSVTETVYDGFYNVPYEVTFNRPEVLDFDVVIQVRNNTYSGDNLTRDVKNAILNWSAGQVEGVDGLKIGQNVSPFEIASAVSTEIPDIYIKSCLVCQHGGTPSSSELTYTIAQIGEIKEANITVTVV